MLDLRYVTLLPASRAQKHTKVLTLVPFRIYWHPWYPWGYIHTDLNKKVSNPAVCATVLGLKWNGGQVEHLRKYKTWFSISLSTLYVCLAMLWVKTLAANNIQTCCQLMYWMKLELEFSDFLSHTCRWLFCSFLYFLFMLRTIILDSSKYQLHI